MAEPLPSAQRKLDDIKVELHTLDSKISLIAQKIRMIEKNEEVIGRTIVMHNEKIHNIEVAAQGSSFGAAQATAAQPAAGASMPTGSAEDVALLKKHVKELREQVSEIKYTLDSINPLNFITITQAKQLIADEMTKRSGGKTA